MTFCLVYVTVPNRQTALAIARDVVPGQLAACANILESMTSVYHWKGKLCEDVECVLLLKTRRSLFSKLKKRIEALHPYDVPCIVALPIEKGNADYLTWLGASTLSR